MFQKSYIPEGQNAPSSQIGATLEALASTISARRHAGTESYTHELLEGDLGIVLGKVLEEAHEVVEAAEEGEVDHLRYEAADVLYHLLVVLERFEIPLDEFAAELNMRMTDKERPAGGVLLHDTFVKRGK